MSKENKRLHLYLYLCTEIFWEDTQENLMVVVMGRWTEGFRLEGFHKYTVTFKMKRKRRPQKAKKLIKS